MRKVAVIVLVGILFLGLCALATIPAVERVDAQDMSSTPGPWFEGFRLGVCLRVNDQYGFPYWVCCPGYGQYGPEVHNPTDYGLKCPVNGTPQPLDPAVTGAVINALWQAYSGTYPTVVEGQAATQLTGGAYVRVEMNHTCITDAGCYYEIAATQLSGWVTRFTAPDELGAWTKISACSPTGDCL